MAQKQITVAYIGMDPNDGTQPQNKNIELARYYTHIESNISLKDTVISYDADSIVSSHHGWVEWDHGVSKTDTKGKWGYSDLIFV